MDNAFYQFLITNGQISPERIKQDEPMSKHTTFRVGGAAAWFVEIASAKELATIIKYLRLTERKYFILGNGSNLLVGDKGYDGVVLHIGGDMADIRIDGTTITAAAGARLTTIAMEAAKRGLTGLEFAAGIPGTLGGAIVMNAGAYDGEMKDVVKKVTLLNEDGEILTRPGDCMEFGYRSSCIKNRPYIVLEVEMELACANPEDIQAKMDDFNGRRRDKQPLEYPSAGSTFKRPEGHFAGKLIMDAGLRGYRIGGAQVAEKHCGFVINVGDATAADIKELMDEVTDIVDKKFGITLEPEVISLGTF